MMNNELFLDTQFSGISQSGVTLTSSEQRTLEAVPDGTLSSMIASIDQRI